MSKQKFFNKTLMFKKQNPELYREILKLYSPVFDKYIAIEMHLNSTPPPVCEICNCRLMVTKHYPTRCCLHINSTFSNLYTYERFIDEFPGEYDPWSGQKVKNDTISITCPVHGKYEQQMSSRMKGHGCQKCHFDSLRGNFRINEDSYMSEFLKVHKDRYDYSKVVFCGAEGKIEIGCKVHGFFWQQANVHKVGHGCPKCSAKATSDRGQSPEIKARFRNTAMENFLKIGKNKDTKPELKFKEYLTQHGVSFEHQFIVLDEYNGKWSFDFYLKDRNLLVEIDGEYWHRISEQFNRDRVKDKLATKQGYNILRISDLDLNFDLIKLSNDDMIVHNSTLLENRSKNLRNRRKNDRSEKNSDVR